MIFASHRIDECSLLCDRVLILNQGKIQFDGSILSFGSIITKYFQVDIYSDEASQPILPPGGVRKSLVELIQEKLDNRLPGSAANGIDRLVQYSKTFFRITCNKHELPVSILWACLDELKNSSNLINQFLFRDISMEEILSNIIDSLNEDRIKKWRNRFSIHPS